MATATATPDRVASPAAVPCGECGEPVLHRYTVEQRPVVLDAQPVEAGIYRIDRHGRAERRSLVLLYREARAGMHVDGFDPHDCAGPRDRPWYQRD